MTDHEYKNEHLRKSNDYIVIDPSFKLERNKGFSGNK